MEQNLSSFFFPIELKPQEIIGELLVSLSYFHLRCYSRLLEAAQRLCVCYVADLGQSPKKTDAAIIEGIMVSETVHAVG